MEILFENEQILIINKPYNLATQGGQGIVNSVDSVLEAQLGKKAYLVHRLDKETSGLLVVAKTAKDAARWTNLIGTKKVKKQYHALCFGKMKEKKGVINESVNDRGIQKDAVTKFTVLKEFHNDEMDMDFSLVELTLETGRMHQIRKHLAGKGCPIINDDKYGDFKKNKMLAKTSGIKKMMLHAKKLTFDPELKIKEIEVKYPEHFAQAIEFFS